MAWFSNAVKNVKYIVKIGRGLQKLDEPMKELRAAGKMPESLERLWKTSGIEEGSEPMERPEEQPGLVDNTMWALFDYVREIEKNAALFDAQYHEVIAECVGYAEMYEKFLRDVSDVKELKKWEKKNGRTYEGPTEREKYYASLQEEAAPEAEAEAAPEAEPAPETGAEPEPAAAAEADPAAAEPEAE